MNNPEQGLQHPPAGLFAIAHLFSAAFGLHSTKSYGDLGITSHA